MGDISEFKLAYQLFIRAYAWRKIDPLPWAPLTKPLREARLGLVSTAGFVLPEQERFDEAIKGGDWSYREIPADTDASTLVDCHKSDAFDHRGITADPNLAFPLDRVREMAQRGEVGSVNHRHLSFMGSIPAPGRLIQRSAPEAAQLFVEDQVDVALLVPV